MEWGSLFLAGIKQVSCYVWLAYQESHLAGNCRLSLQIEDLSYNYKVVTVKNPYELVREAKQLMKTQPSQLSWLYTLWNSEQRT